MVGCARGREGYCPMTTDQLTLTRLDDSPLKRSITGRLLFFYVLGDVLGSGIYVLIGAVPAPWAARSGLAFAVGVTVAAFTGWPTPSWPPSTRRRPAPALYVNRAFKNKALTFLSTVLYLSATLRRRRLAGGRVLDVLRPALGAARRPCW